MDFSRSMLLPLYATLFIFPATMAYVIVVHRAMEVRVVVRQGVQYLLARGTIRAIQLLVSAAVIVGVAIWQPSFAGTGSWQVLLVGGALVAIVQIRGIAERLSRWVDRRFFREAYN